MKRREFLKTAGVSAMASVVAKPALSQAMPELRWRLTSSFPKSLDILYGASEVFAKTVAQASDGKFQIQVFSAGEIVPGLSAADAVQNGTVEICHTASYYFFGKDPTFAFGTSVPFGLNARMQNAWMYFGGAMDLLNNFYKKFNIYAIPAGNTGPDGWVVSQRGQRNFRFQRSENTHWWSRCDGSTKTRCRSSADRGR